jgi:hypothetical protein
LFFNQLHLESNGVDIFTRYAKAPGPSKMVLNH